MDISSQQDKKLRQLFRQLPGENPSADFSSRVMAQVILEAQHARQQERAHNITRLVSLSCIASILLGAGLFAVFHYSGAGIVLWKYFEPLAVSLGDVFSSVADIFTGADNSKAILLGLTVLALLLGDLFIRRHIERKKHIADMAS